MNILGSRGGGLIIGLIERGIFAIPSRFASSDGGYRRGCDRVVERDGGLVASWLVLGFCLLCGDYRACRH